MNKFRLGLVSFCFASVALASSPDAWQALEKDVKDKCLKRFETNAGPGIKQASWLVDVMGAQTFVSGLIRYKLPKTNETVQMICTFDKNKKEVVELYEIPSLEKETNWKKPEAEGKAKF